MTTLPTTILPGDPGHVDHHNRIHGYAGFLDNANIWAQKQTLQAGLDVAGDARFRSGRPWVDVTHSDFGADPTGMADSTAAIQNAIVTAAALGTSVFIPAGRYLVNGQIRVVSGTHLLGAGSNCSVLQFAANVAANTKMLLNVDGVRVPPRRTRRNDLGPRQCRGPICLDCRVHWRDIYAKPADPWPCPGERPQTLGGPLVQPEPVMSRQERRSRARKLRSSS